MFQDSTSWWSPALATHYGLDPIELDLRPFRIQQSGSVRGRIPTSRPGDPPSCDGALGHEQPDPNLSREARKMGDGVVVGLPTTTTTARGGRNCRRPRSEKEAQSLREILEAHRRDPDCASCHLRMDALGFALEPLDAVGRWRVEEEGRPIDAAATLPDGRRIDGPRGLRGRSRARPGVASFVRKALADLRARSRPPSGGTSRCSMVWPPSCRLGRRSGPRSTSSWSATRFVECPAPWAMSSPTECRAGRSAVVIGDFVIASCESGRYCRGKPDSQTEIHQMAKTLHRRTVLRGIGTRHRAPLARSDVPRDDHSGCSSRRSKHQAHSPRISLRSEWSPCARVASVPGNTRSIRHAGGLATAAPSTRSGS